MLTLRPYQETGVNDIRARFNAGDRSVLFVLPTGGGKTVIFTHIAELAAARGNRVWLLGHRVEIVRQIAGALRHFGVHCGMINSNYTPDITAPAQVASVQTLIRRFRKLEPPEIIIVDEAHHATAGSWRTIIEAFPDAIVLGVTATPIRTDGFGLGSISGGIFDAMVVGPQKQQLIEMGYLAPAVVYGPPKVRVDFSDVDIVNDDFDKEQLEKKLDEPVIIGDAVDHYKEICDGVPAVAFCVSVAHAEHVAHEFRAAGYSAYSVDGSMDDETRTRILDGLGDGTIQIVTSCDIISEGTDIPAIVCAIMLRPTMSLGLYLQQAGRPARISDGKTECILLDHVGNVERHGLPDANREWSLEGRKMDPNKKKSGTRKSIQRVAKVVQCESCGIVHEPAPECPHCGHLKGAKMRKPKQVAGKLEIITEQSFEEKKEK